MRTARNQQVFRTMAPALIVAMLCSFACGKVIYVDDDAAGANDGSSWADAYNYLQDALSDAEATDKPVEIRIAQGIYKPDRGVIQRHGDRSATFQLINEAVIKGGFAGISELNPDIRNVEVYETILSGDLKGDDVEAAISRDLSDETSREDNSYHVLNGSGTDGTALLDGFTITGGNAAGSSYDAHGGGTFNETGSPSITNCTFTLNSTRSNGGGMFNQNSSPNLTNCTFTMNSAHSGSGIYNDHNSHPTVTNCMFIDNAAYYGSGMYNREASNPVLNDCTFSGGISEYQGGGINNRYLSNPTLINCTFIGNSARDGAGMHNYESSPIIANCVFTGNKADRGGGMYNERYSHPILTNCTFSRNIAEVGNALACDTLSFTPGKEYPSIIDLHNCILWDAGMEIWNYDGSTINISYSNVPDSQDAIYDPCEAIIWADGNINSDPLFVDADGDDNVVGTEDDDLRLLEGSPCIDAGDSSAVPPSVVTDVDGNPRITNSRVDMGAYERPAKYFVFGTRSLFVPEGSTTTFTVALVEAPSEAVEVAVAHNSGDQDITVESGGLLSFDTSNYSVPQTFTLSAAEDSDNLNGIARIRISTPNFFADVKVTESDNEPYVGVLFVDDDAAGNNNGSNWTDAYINLQDALNSSANIGVQEIRIAQGIYRPDQGSGNIPSDRTATFQLINGVTIRGGFAGVGEVDPDVRDIEIYKTVLSGDPSDNDFDVNEPVVLPYESTRADNSYHVVTGSSTDGTAVLDGVTISSGNAVSWENGGGMYNIAGSPTIANCTFTWNWAWYGGGMYNGNSSPTLTNCTFSMNSGFCGGGMYSQAGRPGLTNCLFTDNSSTIPPGYIVERVSDCGGGMYNYHSNSTLTNCTFSGNSSVVGGGLYNSVSYPDLTNCTFTGNSAYEGRAIYNFRSNPIVRNCILWNGGNEIQSGFTSSINVTFSDIQGGWEGEGNIDVDPLFADPDNGDFHLKSEYGRWDSASDSWVVDDVTSPCIDAGDPNSPVGDEPEPNGGRINMGAYGGTKQASKSYSPWWFATTAGPVVAEGLGIVLPHEHIFTDLRGPTTPGYGQADPADVVRVMSPLLADARRKGVGVLFECSSIGVGRNVSIVAQVAQAAELPVVVPTGVYGRANFAPPQHQAMTEDELTTLFIAEIRDGIEGTGTKAGFIKIATGNGPMTALEEKFLRAAGRAASQTGAAIASHTPIGSNAVRQADILQSIDPAIRLIWVHAQNESNRSLHRQLAARGVFIEFDSLGWNPSQDPTFIAAIKELLAAGHADRILLSHDAGWYQPGQPNGGTQKPYTYLIDAFIRKLRSAGVDDATIRLITETNPIRAFGFKSN